MGSQGPYARIGVALEGGEERSVYFAPSDEPEEEAMPCLMKMVERGMVREGSHLLFHHLPEEKEWFRWGGYRDRLGMWKKGPGVTINVDRLVPVYEAVPFCRLRGFVTGRLGIEEVTTERSMMGVVRHRILQRHWRLLWGELSSGHGHEEALRAARIGTQDFIQALAKELNLPDLQSEAATTLSTCEEVSNDIMEWTGPGGYFCWEYNLMSSRLGLIGRADFVGLRKERPGEGRIIEYKITDKTQIYQNGRSPGPMRALLQASTYSQMFKEAAKTARTRAEVWVFDKWTGGRAFQHVAREDDLEQLLRQCLWARDEYLFSTSCPIPVLDEYGRAKCRECSFKGICRTLSDYKPDEYLSRVRDGLDMEAEASWRAFQLDASLDDLFEDGMITLDNVIVEYSEDDLKVKLESSGRASPVRGSFVRFSPIEATHGWGFGVVRGVEGDLLDIRLRDPLTPSLLSQGRLRLDFSVPVDFSNRAKIAITAIEIPQAFADQDEIRSHLGELRRAFESASSVPSCALEGDFVGLNQSQQKAARMIMGSKLTVIHGPFGSGKTTVIARASLELAKSGRKVLVASYTNNAVNNAMEMITKLAREEGVDLKQVRVATGEAADGLAEMRIVDPHRYGKDDLAAMREADVVGSTLISCLSNAFRDAYMEGDGYYKLRYLPFEVCIIDEASQCLLPYALIPCLLSRRWVLVGDHRQLEPLILDPRAGKDLTSWFDLAVKDLEGAGGIVMLDVQYRCPHEVGSYLSRQFYDSKLRNDEGDEGHDHPAVSADLAAVSRQVNAKLARAALELRLSPGDLSRIVDPANHLIFTDTQARSRESGRRSKCNVGEAIVSAELLRILGTATEDLLFLSPYQAQNSMLRGMLEGGLKMGTVDSYQGRQADIVLLSLVRSNSSGLLGFLRNVRRLNVAMSRCTKKLIVIADSATIRMNRADLQAREALMDYMRTAKELGTYISIGAREERVPMRMERRPLSLRPSLKRRSGAA